MLSWLDCCFGFLSSCCNAGFGFGCFTSVGLFGIVFGLDVLGGLVVTSGFWFLASCWFSSFWLPVCGFGMFGAGWWDVGLGGSGLGFCGLVWYRV